ncbi:hypothetical protein [Rossellomorea sp. NPDC077527]|uniref:hypothetical protein n=1 Tax=Rossellomorea sp. NPDC077527 TaxID=3364510 RepID=UPI0037C9AE3C
MLTMAIVPLVLIGAVAVWVIQRLHRKHSQDTSAQTTSKAAQDLLDSLIPVGMIFGSAFGVIISILFSTSLLFTVSVGAGIGLLVGFIAYEVCTLKEST